jgi:hypothetical protein
MSYRLSTSRRISALAILLTLRCLLPDAFASGSEESQFESQDFAAAFPGKPFAGHADGFYTVVYFGEISSQSVQVFPLPKFDTRSKLFEQRARHLHDTNPGMVILEYSPIKWHGHYGHETCYLSTDEKGRLQVCHRRDLVIGDQLYQLEHRGQYAAVTDDPHINRLLDRRDAHRFFQSFRLLKPVEPTSKPEAQLIHGRWIVVAGPDAKANPLTADGRPREMAFLGRQLFLGPMDSWGERGGMHPVGTFKVEPVGKSETEPREYRLTVNILGNAEKQVQSTFRIVGDELHLAAEDSSSESSTESTILRRPGDSDTSATGKIDSHVKP